MEKMKSRDGNGVGFLFYFYDEAPPFGLGSTPLCGAGGKGWWSDKGGIEVAAIPTSKVDLLFTQVWVSRRGREVYCSWRDVPNLGRAGEWVCVDVSARGLFLERERERERGCLYRRGF